MNNYVKLNNNSNHLSLGNLFNIIKKLSINKNSAIQTEIFCILFDIDNISDTTVGNYCTGYRAIGSDYKQKYLNYRKKYNQDNSCMLQIINNLLSIIDGTIYNYTNITTINSNKSLITLCQKIHILAKNDLYVPSKTKKQLLDLLNKNKYYDFLCHSLFFIVLEKQQPLYEHELVEETIEKILENTNISVEHLKKYLLIKFNEGISYIPSLKKLADNNNPYALHELGNLEYTGTIYGYPRYDEAYKYYLKAANYNHPASLWMMGYMIINEKIGKLTDDDLKLAWNYLKKAESLNSVSSLNTIGLCYLKGLTPDKKQDINKAITYFNKAIKHNYVYAYNNLGKIYEEKGNYEKAFENYLISANYEDSWACNKIGLFYYYGNYTEKDINKAYEYFKKGANAPINNRIPWNIYNLVKLFYLSGNNIIGIKKDIDKSLELLNTIKDFEPAQELFLYCYYERYLNNKNEENLNKVKYYLSIVNNYSDKSLKEKITKSLKDIYNYHIDIKL